MTGEPELVKILPHLVVPAVLALLLFALARKHGASWVQICLSAGVAMLGAFMAASGWVFAAYITGEQVSALKVLGSQVLVGGSCGLVTFFGTMPQEVDLSETCNEPNDGDDR